MLCGASRRNSNHVSGAASAVVGALAQVSQFFMLAFFLMCTCYSCFTHMVQ